MKEIKLVGRFGLGLHANAQNVLDCVCRMLDAQHGEDIVLDFSDVEFLYPSGINMLVVVGKYLIHEKGCKIRQSYPDDPEVKNFLVESGFSEAVGVPVVVDHSIPPHDKKNIYKIRNFEWCDDEEIHKIIDLIEKELELSGGVRSLIHENLAELVANAIDHGSSFLNCQVIGQGYSVSHRVRFCIADAGIGIKRHLGNRYKDLLEKDSIHSIKEALIEGVTGTATDQNSGLGLSNFRQFIDVCGGTFIIISGNGYYAEERIEQPKKSIIEKTLDFEFPGTLIDFTIPSVPGKKVFLKTEPVPKEYKLIE